MKLKEVEQSIIEACLDEDGFLVQLHSHARFDDAKYQSLTADLSEYANLLAGRTQINRHVAGCLFQLFLQLDIALSTYPRLNHPNLQEVREAHRTVWSQLDRIFTLPD